MMKSRFRKLSVESLEGRSVLSTMYQADFNGDGRLDQAAVTNLGTVEIRLDNGSGGYDVSDILAAPTNQGAIVDIYFVRDIDQDGDLDLETTYQKPSGDIKVASFRNNGDGTFEYNEPIEPVKWKGPKPRWAF
jgi:hypothetical protein